MLRKKLTNICIIALVFCLFSLPVQAQGYNEVKSFNQSAIVQPCFTNIVLFQNTFDISTGGKATVSVYLTAQNIDKVKVDANLQKYQNGTWETIKTWTSTTAGTYSGLSGEIYVSSGYSYRVVSSGTVYKNGMSLETTTGTSVSKKY